MFNSFYFFFIILILFRFWLSLILLRIIFLFLSSFPGLLQVILHFRWPMPIWPLPALLILFSPILSNFLLGFLFTFLRLLLQNCFIFFYSFVAFNFLCIALPSLQTPPHLVHHIFKLAFFFLIISISSFVPFIYFLDCFPSLALSFLLKLSLLLPNLKFF